MRPGEAGLIVVIAGREDARYHLEYSADLEDWSIVTAALTHGESFHNSDNSDESRLVRGRGYYRAVELDPGE